MSCRQLLPSPRPLSRRERGSISVLDHMKSRAPSARSARFPLPPGEGMRLREARTHSPRSGEGPGMREGSVRPSPSFVRWRRVFFENRYL